VTDFLTSLGPALARRDSLGIGPKDVRKFLTSPVSEMNYWLN